MRAGTCALFVPVLYKNADFNYNQTQYFYTGEERRINMSGFTKKAIKESFMKLLSMEPVSKITVKQLVEDCGINRNTFYYHYDDIPSLLEEIIHDETDRIISQYPTIDTLEKGLEVAIEFALENRTAVMHIYKSVNRDIYEKYLWQMIEYVCKRYFETLFKGANYNRNDKTIVANYYKCACFGLITDWLENDMREDLVKQFKRMCFLDKGHLEQLIKKCEK